MQSARLAIYPNATAAASRLPLFADVNPHLAANLILADVQVLLRHADVTLAANRNPAANPHRQFLLPYCQNATANTNQNRLMRTLRQFILTASA